MKAGIPVEELDAETKAKLHLNNPPVEIKIITLGKVLQDLSPLTNRQAIWCLRNAITLIKGYKEKVRP